MMSLAVKVPFVDDSGVNLVKLDEVKAAMSVLPDPEFGVQVQALPHAKWKTCKGDDPEGIAIAAVELASGSRGVYWTLNPCPNGLSSPMATKYAVCRRWLMVDIDPRREKDTNATEAEHEAAREAAYQVQHDLSEAGWPTPLIMDSGNGWQLLYRIDLDNSKESQALLRDAIKALADQYDSDVIEVDRKVHDGRRLSKLPGTLTRKGPSTDDRPHRWAKLVFVPDVIEVVTADQLRELAGAVEQATQPARNGTHPSIHAVKAGVDRKRAYARRALECEIANVVLAARASGNDALNKSAFAIGQLVGAGAILRQEAESGLFMATIGRRPEAEARATIKSGLDAGIAQPRDLAFLDEPSTNGTHETNGKHESPKKDTRNDAPHIITLDKLMRTEFPPVKWAVPGLLSEGLSILAGKPKLGKSWLALNLGITIAAGGKALGDVETVAGDVLYLALEDRLRRVQNRARKVLAGLGLEASQRLHIAVEWPRQDKGGLAYIDKWLTEADNPRLVIIDVIAKFRTASTGRRNAYDEDYAVLSDIKSVLDEHACSGLGLMHLKKGKSDDPLEDITGSMGNSGSADGVMMLVRTRGENEAVLGITGRDVDEKKIAIKFNPENCCWSSLGDAGALSTSRIRQKIMGAFRAQPGGKFQPKGMADIINEDPGTVRMELWRMLGEGILRKIGQAYQWPLDEVM